MFNFPLRDVTVRRDISGALFTIYRILTFHICTKKRGNLKSEGIQKVVFVSVFADSGRRDLRELARRTGRARAAGKPINKRILLQKVYQIA